MPTEVGTTNETHAMVSLRQIAQLRRFTIGLLVEASQVDAAFDFHLVDLESLLNLIQSSFKKWWQLFVFIGFRLG